MNTFRMTNQLCFSTMFKNCFKKGKLYALFTFNIQIFFINLHSLSLSPEVSDMKTPIKNQLKHPINTDFSGHIKTHHQSLKKLYIPPVNNRGATAYC